MLNIQEISSRTWVDPSMETSLEHQGLERNSSFNRSREVQERVQLAAPSGENSVVPKLEEMIHYQRRDLEHKSKLINSYALHMQNLEKSNMSKSGYEASLQEMSRLMLEKDSHYDELRRKYEQAIFSLKDTVMKNEILSREMERVSRKLKDSELSKSGCTQTTAGRRRPLTGHTTSSTTCR